MPDRAPDRHEYVGEVTVTHRLPTSTPAEQLNSGVLRLVELDTHDLPERVPDWHEYVGEVTVRHRLPTSTPAVQLSSGAAVLRQVALPNSVPELQVYTTARYRTQTRPEPVQNPPGQPTEGARVETSP